MHDDALRESGTREAFDREMATYNQLEKKELPEIGEDGMPTGNVVSAESVIKPIDDDLEGLDSVLRCSRG